jgi:hypothetical protein
VTVRNALPIRDGRIRVEPGGGRTVTVTFGDSLLEVLPKYHETFCLLVHRPDARTSGQIVANFWEMETRLRDWHVSDFGDGFGADDIFAWVRSIRHAFLEDFDRAVQGGAWRIFASVQSPFEPLEEVPPHVWRNYRVVDGANGVAATASSPRPACDRRYA